MKLLKLNPGYQEGFILTDCPGTVYEAQVLEEFKGGLNAFVHLNLPAEVLVDIEENKCKCAECEKMYYKKDVISKEHGIHIEKFMPLDGHCDDCGSTNFVDGSDPARFE